MPKAAAPISKKVSTTADSYKTQQPLKQPWQSNNLSNAVTSEIQPAENQPSSLGSPSAADSSHSDVQAQHKRQLFGSSQESSSWMSDAASGLTGKAHALWSGKVGLYQPVQSCFCFIGCGACWPVTCLHPSRAQAPQAIVTCSC